MVYGERRNGDAKLDLFANIYEFINKVVRSGMEKYAEDESN